MENETIYAKVCKDVRTMNFPTSLYPTYPRVANPDYPIGSLPVMLSIALLGIMLVLALFFVLRQRRKKIELCQNAFMNWQRAKWDFKVWTRANPEISANCDMAQGLIHTELGLLRLLQYHKPLTQREIEREKFLISLCRRDFVMHFPQYKTRT